ncbi:MAG: hypothetical protein MPJ50_06240 [Pirellulales bacterium]|nr:hypothetical protein [Pirellulales bacterium]
MTDEAKSKRAANKRNSQVGALFSWWSLPIGAALSAGICVGFLSLLGQDNAKGEFTTAAGLAFVLVLIFGQLARRRFRVSIRTLLIITSIVGIVCAFVGRKIDAARREAAAIAQFLESGGSVVYRESGKVDGKWFYTDNGWPIPLWVKEQCLGEHFFDSIYELRCEGLVEEDCDTMRLLQDLRRVEQLDVFGDDCIQGDALAEMPLIPGLHTLRLRASQFTAKSATRLNELPDLELLEIHGWSKTIMPESIRAMRSLHELRLNPEGLSEDVCHEIANLPSLRVLRLDSTLKRAPFLFRLGPPPRLGSEVHTQAFAISTSITHLEFCYWRLVGDSVLEPLESMRNLKHLSLHGCVYDNDAVVDFRKVRPDVEVIQ